MPRLFASIPLTEEARAALALHQKPAHPFIRWTDPSQLHITLCFLSDVDESSVPSVSERLAKLAARTSPFTLQISRFRFKQPSMIWAEIDRSEAFDRLYAQSHNEMAKISPEFVWIAEEMRSPQPHVTMARLGRNAPTITLPLLAAPIPLAVARIDLMESSLTPAGPVYKERGSFLFTDV